jgi:hypothetical protein
MQIRTDYDDQVSFSQLRTYDWVNEEAAGGDQPAINSPLVNRRIRHAVDSALAALGYERITTGTPDFQVANRIVAKEETKVYPSYGYGGYGYGSYYGYGGFGRRFGRYRGLGYGGYSPYYGSGRVRNYVRGTVVLDVVDARTNELIWRGWASESLSDNPEPDRVQRYVNAAVQKILAEFPRRQTRGLPHVAPDRDPPNAG